MYQDLVHKGIIVPQPEVPPPPVPMDYAWAREVKRGATVTATDSLFEGHGFESRQNFQNSFFFWVKKIQTKAP